MLFVEHLEISRQHQILIHKLSCQVQPGQVLVFEGPNGAGKTTLLRTLAGLHRPEAGQIRWQGESIFPKNAAFQRELLYLGHETGLSGTLNAEENLRFLCGLRGVQVSKDAIWQVLAAVGLSGREDIPVANLSAGQKRRVALSRLWLTPAKLWILDEPLTALDVRAVDGLMSQIEKHAQTQGMVILTSHQPVNISSQFKRVLNIGAQS